MKIKPILPSLREKKRYLAFEIISEEPVKEAETVANTIYEAGFKYLGEMGMAKAGALVLKDKYSNNKGIVRVNHKNLENFKSALMLVKKVNKQDVMIRTLGVSGILKKAENKYMAN